MSAEFLMACSDGDECFGGYLLNAWNFIATTGLVTGGGFNSKTGCQPYELPSCEHKFSNGTKTPCDKIIVPASFPSCEKKCTNSEYKTSYEADFHKVTSVNQYDDIKSVQEDIMRNGPIVAGFDIYEDFLHYKSGVYQYVTGKYLGGHAVRVLGWGTENGTPYWLVANSWNSDWGDKGLFKIKRGSDECGFENQLISGSV
uniref:Peptidase C1A papain C-terminal domain-containing protein n=1 Tax=Lygus hesperus TaxID=30085 RepID=A0A0K8TFB3_LYGHE